MNLARRALNRADAGKTTVTTIATAHGFGELGRFAVQYRKLFGERPSATLRRPAIELPIVSPHDLRKTQNVQQIRTLEA
jgi:AraC family ethanolamine operon transcriptional activator